MTSALVMNKAKPQDVPDFSWPNGPAALLPFLPSHSSQGRETTGTMDHFLHKKDWLPQAGMHHPSALGERSPARKVGLLPHLPAEADYLSSIRQII